PLDPTLRRMETSLGGPLILADTVGFIRDLPHELIAAFRATLEESRNADVLLHVSDAADPERREHGRQVESVLVEIGAGHVPRIDICNKIDQLAEQAPQVECVGGGLHRAWGAAAAGAGVEALRAALAVCVRA